MIHTGQSRSGYLRLFCDVMHLYYVKCVVHVLAGHGILMHVDPGDCQDAKTQFTSRYSK